MNKDDILNGDSVPQTVLVSDKWYIEKHENGWVYLRCKSVLSPAEVKELVDELSAPRAGADSEGGENGEVGKRT